MKPKRLQPRLTTYPLPLTWTTIYILGGNEFLRLKNGRVVPKHITNTKRDIVDTSFHASCVFGHDLILGLAFTYI